MDVGSDFVSEPMPAKRRRPKQLRAIQTVEAVLDAVARILKRGGVDAVTTNRIAKVAGVSIGSVYQYFPDKRAIFVALHQRHVEFMARVVEDALLAHASLPLPDLAHAMIDAMVDAHAKDAELHELLWSEVPHRADGARDLEARLVGAWRLAITSKLGARREAERVAFFVAHVAQAVAHAVLARPSRMSLAAAKEEATRAVTGYLRR
jgi:AcrR family transcriptional regulator